MGRKRAYAPLDVYMNGRRVGQYFRAPAGAFAFTYAPEWLAWENTLPISRALPLRPERYTGPPVIAVFENLLPDSDLIRRRVAERLGADGVNARLRSIIVSFNNFPLLRQLPHAPEFPDFVQNLKIKTPNCASSLDVRFLPDIWSHGPGQNARSCSSQQAFAKYDPRSWD